MKKYPISQLIFNENNELVLPTGKVLTHEYCKKYRTLQLCIDELRTTGHIKCKICGAEASFISLHQTKETAVYYFYVVKNGQSIRLTKDHIVPKSLNFDYPSDSNMYQIACDDCNIIKNNEYNNLSAEERYQRSILVKRKHWADTFCIFTPLAKFCKKYKKDKVLANTIKSYLSNKVMDYINICMNSELSIEQIKSRIDYNLMEFKSEQEKDFVNLFVVQEHTHKASNPRILPFIKNFQYRVLQDYKNYLTF